MIIKVTQSHIDRGCRGDGQACPVALALEETLGCICTVDSVSIIVGVGPDSFAVPTPTEVQVFICKFDNGADVEPFEFELDVEGVGRG